MADETPDAIRPICLDGGRFKRASEGEIVGFPLSASRELARYDDLVFGVAKRLWRSDHPAAGQVPREFESKVRLRLTDVDRGSVKPVLRSLAPQGSIGSTLGGGYADRARHLIAAALAAFLASGSLPPDFPAEEVPALARIAKSLQDDEVAIFAREDGSGVRYARADQRRLERFVRTTRPRNGEVMGMVTAMNPDDSCFTFRLPRGKKITGRYAGSSVDADLVAAMAAQEVAAYVALDCNYSIDASDRVVSIDFVRSVSPISHPNDPLGTRLRQLAELPRNWDGAGADPVSIDALRVAQQVAHECQAQGIPLPHAFLTLEGGVSLEEQPAATRWSLEIEPDGAMLIAVAGGDATPRVEEPETPTDAANSLKAFLS